MYVEGVVYITEIVLRRECQLYLLPLGHTTYEPAYGCPTYTHWLATTTMRRDRKPLAEREGAAPTT